MMTLEQAHAWIARSLPEAQLQGLGTSALARVHTDSRSLKAGDLFVALRGERMDGHDFLPQAHSQGAVAAIVETGRSQPGLACIEVADTTQGLGALAAGWRSQFALPLIAVTGSNGKTTVTQMLASILQAHAGEASLATRGNFNNAIGVPLTLLRLRGEHQIAVVELGMNHPGEIATLAQMAQPTVALVNNAQREHQEFMHTVQAVAEENGSVISSLPADGVAVFPAHDTFTPLWRQLAGTRPVLTFAAEQADVWARSAQWQQGAWQVEIVTPQGAMEVRLGIAGRHNVLNALAATACALAAGVPLAAIAQGLQAFAPVNGRSRALVLPWAGGRCVQVIDDSYNANPDSVQAAIAMLAELPAPHLLVLGDMAEVGSEGPAFHAEVGASAQAAGIAHLIAYGTQSAHTVAAFGAGAQHAVDKAAACSAALALVQDGVASVLVKGSRSMGMEVVVQALQQAAATQTQEGAAC